jgi:hypothetical protein
MLETAGAGLTFFEEMAAPEEFDAPLAVAALDTEDVVWRNFVAELLMGWMAANKNSGRLVQIADYCRHNFNITDAIGRSKPVSQEAPGAPKSAIIIGVSNMLYLFTLNARARNRYFNPIAFMPIIVMCQRMQERSAMIHMSSR